MKAISIQSPHQVDHGVANIASQQKDGIHKMVRFHWLSRLSFLVWIVVIQPFTAVDARITH